jgi:glutaredoxin
MTGKTMEPITVYSTNWCPDCVRAKSFMKSRGVDFREVNIENDPDAEDLVIRVNHGKRRVPTIQIGERFFACSPYNPVKLAAELNIALNS